MAECNHLLAKVVLDMVELNLQLARIVLEIAERYLLLANTSRLNAFKVNL